MIRTKHNLPLLAQADELSQRIALAASLGLSYSGARDLYEALGYPKDLKVTDYTTKYSRQEIAKAIIKRPSSASWGGDVMIEETNDADSTPLEIAWEELFNTLGLKNKFSRADRLCSLGRYAILLLGFDDTNETYPLKQPVKAGKRKLLFVKPVSESNATISKTETDTSNPRFSLPVEYTVRINETASYQVHYTRVIHICWELLESEIYGTPVLEAVYNRLMDIEKISGGSAEIFWREARPGYHANIDKEFTQSPTTDDAIKTQLTEYEHNLRRFIVGQGFKIEQLKSNGLDPTPYIGVQIDLIATETGIPKRILVGSERGELSSGQDADSWASFVQNRREELLEVVILRPFINKCIELGVLPAPKDKKKGYSIRWSDLYSQSEKERAEVGKIRATALKEYASQPGAAEMVPWDAFAEMFLGLDSQQIELLNKMRMESVLEEKPLSPEEQAAIEQEQEQQ